MTQPPVRRLSYTHDVVPDIPQKSNKSLRKPVEPRWTVVIATLAVVGLYSALPEHLTLGPNGFVAAVVVALLIPSLIAHRTGRVGLNTILGTAVLVVITVAQVWALVVLIGGIPAKRQTAGELMRSAISLWVSNVLVSACWYWRLDAGGPHRRALRDVHTEGAFLFPQMVLPDELKGMAENWKPGFIDYLFIAFNTSTAFSPTDSPVLSRWAKIVSMCQASISLATIAILAARAINIF